MRVCTEWPWSCIIERRGYKCCFETWVASTLLEVIPAALITCTIRWKSSSLHKVTGISRYLFSVPFSFYNEHLFLLYSVVLFLFFTDTNIFTAKTCFTHLSDLYWYLWKKVRLIQLLQIYKKHIMWTANSSLICISLSLLVILAYECVQLINVTLWWFLNIRMAHYVDKCSDWKLHLLLTMEVIFS